MRPEDPDLIETGDRYFAFPARRGNDGASASAWPSCSRRPAST
jgi:hypothetical protein